uniref:Uncharacterized protein n=1 Tax=Oryza rufipogon TaxID=4529 RepID=A0A0E0MRC4_ORYRU
MSCCGGNCGCGSGCQCGSGCGGWAQAAAGRGAAGRGWRAQAAGEHLGAGGGGRSCARASRPLYPTVATLLTLSDAVCHHGETREIAQLLPVLANSDG